MENLIEYFESVQIKKWNALILKYHVENYYVMLLEEEYDNSILEQIAKNNFDDGLWCFLL